MSFSGTLGELCAIEKGNSPTLKTEPGKYPLVVTAEYRRSASTYQFDRPAVCIPLISSTGHGDAAIHRIHYQEGRFALANLLVALIPRDQSVCFPRYLYLMLQAQKDHLLVPLMRGTANVSLKEKDIASVQVTLPPLSEQKKIVEWIDAVATRVEEARTVYERTSEMRHGFVSSLHVSLSENGDTKIKDFLELDEDRVHVERDGEYPQIGLRGFGGGIFFRETLKGDQTKYQHFNRLYDGAVVLSQVKGWEGAIAVAPPDFQGHFSSPEYRTFRCKETVLPEYLAALVPNPWFWKQLAELTRGVGARRERIRPEMFLEMRINMPSIEDQRKALELYRRLAETEVLRESIPSQLEAILPSVLNETFNGGDND